MGVPTSKSELQAAVSERFGKLELVLSQIPEALQSLKTMEGHAKGTVMSPADLVAYLIGWNELVLMWLARDDKGESVVFPEAGYKWNELGKLAQKFYADYAALSFDERRERLAAVNLRIRQEITARSDEELYGASWHGKWTKGRMIQFNTSSPYENARGRLRSWLKSQNQP